MKKYLLFLVSFALSCNSSDQTKTNTQETAVKDSIATIDTAAAPVVREETEAEESERIAKERAEADAQAYNELNVYDGSYNLNTESEGAEGKLTLTYKGDRVFKFKLELLVSDVCTGTIENELTMDRTQHGVFQTDGCFLHFNFMGNYAESGMIIEIEQADKCDLMKGDCIFTGQYLSGNKPTN